MSAKSIAPTCCIAYIPVIHRGYLEFLQRISSSQVYVLGDEILGEFDQLRKDVRRLAPSQVVTALAALMPEKTFTVLDRATLEHLQTQTQLELQLPDEDCTRELVAKYFAGHVAHFTSVFLRWDLHRSLAEVQITAYDVISREKNDQKMMKLARLEAEKSADWWRQVGAVALKDDQIIATVHNHHVPTEQQPYADGDPRGNFHKGEHLDKSTAFHAEAAVIAQAAATGQNLTGAELYVTTFPCPSCAKLIAYSGISTVFFAEGYAMVDGLSILESRGVKLVRVVE